MENNQNTNTPNLDEQEAQKEARRLAREENRRQKEEAKEQARQNRNSKPKMTQEQKKKIIIIGAAAIAVIIFLLSIKPFINFINGIGNNNSPSGYLLLTDITGYTEEDAIKDLRETGFVNIKKEYIYDQFTQDGCIVKTDHHVNSELKPDDAITMFICDKSLIQIIGDDTKDSAVSQTTERTYFTMDGISVVDMAIKDNIFYAILKNNNNEAIKNIQYGIGYQDSDGADIGENKYKMASEYTVLPGEKFEISMEIRNVYANYLYISGLTYNKIEVPEQERN